MKRWNLGLGILRGKVIWHKTAHVLGTMYFLGFPKYVLRQSSLTFPACWPGRKGSNREMCAHAALCAHAQTGTRMTVVLAHAQTGCVHPCDAGSHASVLAYVAASTRVVVLEGGGNACQLFLGPGDKQAADHRLGTLY